MPTKETKKETKTPKKVATKKQNKEKTTKKTENKETKRTIVKVEEAPINQESIKNEESDITEEVKVILDNNPVQVKKYNNLPTLIIVFIVALILIFGIIAISKNASTSKHKLNVLCPTCFDENATFELPKGYYFAEDGSLFNMDNNTLKYAGGMYAGQIDEESFNEQINAIKETNEVEELLINELTVNKVSQEFEETVYEYYFIYSEGSMIQLVLINPEDNLGNNIINSIKK